MESPVLQEKLTTPSLEAAKSLTATHVISVKNHQNEASCPSQDVQEADSSTTTSKPMIKWHIPKPTESSINNVSTVQEPFTPLTQPIQSSVSSTIVTSTVESEPGQKSSINQVSSTTCDPKTSLPKPVLYSSDSSSMSSSSSDDSSSGSDSEGYQPRPSNRIIIKIEGGEIPRQLMMRCRVNIVRLNIHAPEYYSEDDDDDDEPAYINNTAKEKIARPLSKRKPSSIKDTSLPKVRSAKSLLDNSFDDEEANTLKVLEKCRNCRVVLVDCMKGDLMNLYSHSLSPSGSNSETEDLTHKRHKKRKKKKHKHKSDKEKKLKMGDEARENVSKTKNRKHKVRGERKRVVSQAGSSDEEALYSSRAQQQLSKEEQMARAEKVRLLAEKAGMQTPSNPVKQEASPEKAPSPRKAKTYLTPWSEAIATSGIPKIPKLSKQEKPECQDLKTSTEQQQKCVNPYERVLKREARRREFEKMAAAKYGSHSHNRGQPSSSSNNTRPVTALNQSQRTPSTEGSVRSSHTTPTYQMQIPRPPIPGEMQQSSRDIHKARSSARTPVSASHSMPPAVIPQPKKTLLPDPVVVIPETSTSKSKALLPEPPSLLPSPKGLLPDPSPEDLEKEYSTPDGSTQTVQEKDDEVVDHLLDEIDWKIISQPSAPAKEHRKHSGDRRSTSRSAGSSRHSQENHHRHSSSAGSNHRNVGSDRRKSRSSHRDFDDVELNDESSQENVNQGVLDEICRLSLVISKRLAEKSAETTASSHPTNVESSEKPPLPSGPPPPPDAEPPRLPTPPPSLLPPPLPPSLIRQSELEDQSQESHHTNVDEWEGFGDDIYHREPDYLETEPFSAVPAMRHHAQMGQDNFAEDDYEDYSGYGVPFESSDHVETEDYSWPHGEVRHSRPIRNYPREDPFAARNYDAYQAQQVQRQDHIIRDRYGLPIVHSDRDDGGTDEQSKTDRDKTATTNASLSKTNKIANESEVNPSSPVSMELSDENESFKGRDGADHRYISNELNTQTQEANLVAQDAKVKGTPAIEAAVPILSKITETLFAINDLVQGKAKTDVKKTSSSKPKPLKDKQPKCENVRINKAENVKKGPVKKRVGGKSEISDYSDDDMLTRPNLAPEPPLRRRQEVALWLKAIDDTAKLEDDMEANKKVVSESMDDVPLEELQKRLAHLKNLVKNPSASKSRNEKTKLEEKGQESHTENLNSCDKKEEKFTLTPELQKLLASIAQQNADTSLNADPFDMVDSSEAKLDQKQLNSADVYSNHGSGRGYNEAEPEERLSEHHETADFFLRLNQDDLKQENVIPGLNPEKTPEDYEAELGKPKYSYPYSVHELFDEMSEQVMIVLTNRSSADVLKALIRIFILHNLEPVTFRLLKQRNPHITDLNSIYNKALINLLSDDDHFWLITAVRIQQWMPDLEVHPLILQALLKLHDELST